MRIVVLEIIASGMDDHKSEKKLACLFLKVLNRDVTTRVIL